MANDDDGESKPRSKASRRAGRSLVPEKNDAHFMFNPVGKDAPVQQSGEPAFLRMGLCTNSLGANRTRVCGIKTTIVYVWPCREFGISAFFFFQKVRAVRQNGNFGVNASEFTDRMQAQKRRNFLGIPLFMIRRVALPYIALSLRTHPFTVLPDVGSTPNPTFS